MTGSFEAKNYMYRKNKDGIIVGLVVHPNDVDAAFAALPIGARVMIGWAAIGDDEKRIENDVVEVIKTAPENNVKVIEHKPKKRFEDLPIVQQCAIRCDDEEFAKWFVAPDYGQTVAEGVRAYLGVKSRTELATNKVAAGAWRDLEHQYQNWLTDQKYGQARR